MEGISSGLKVSFVDPNLLLHIPENNLLRCLVLVSMVLQILLIFVGAVRHRCVSRILSSVGWLTYISADAVAMYALGLMVHSDQSPVMGIFYAIWAPVLLMHLGGPDSITAYSLADNEFWPRHALTMSYHVCVAAYVIYASALEAAEKGEWYLLAAAVLVFIAGSCKYGERTVALWLASSSEIVSHALTIHKYMQHQIGGNKEWHYIVKGYEEFYDEFLSREEKYEWSREKLQEIGVVTVEDVKDYEGGLTENYLLCASYALFQMYTPRLARLSPPNENLVRMSGFYQGVLSDSKGKFIKMLNREMRLVYDYLFSKSRATAFSIWGTVMRVCNTCLLAIACFLILSRLPVLAKEKDGDGGQEMVTYILMSVAVALEVFQLCRIMLSDWAMVWLISSYICRFHRPERTELYTAKLVKCVMVVLGKVRKVLEDKDEKGWIQQHSVVETCLRSSPLVRKVREFLHFPEFIIRWLYMNAIVPSSIRATAIDHDTKGSILWGVPYKYKRNNQLEVYDVLHKDMDLSGEPVEVQILAWHVATTMCQRLYHDESKNAKDESIERSTILSRYFGYLLVSCPEMLPVHPAIAKMKYEELCSEISGFVNKRKKNATEEEFWSMLRECKGKSTVGIAAEIARQLLTKSENDPWSTTYAFWARLLSYCGFFFKAAAHGERMTGGGELLTQKWMMLGHWGVGERSDSAVADRALEWQKEHDFYE